MKSITISTELNAVVVGLAASLSLALPKQGECAEGHTNGMWNARRVEWRSEFFQSSGSFRAAHGESERRDNTGFFPRAYAPGKLSLMAGSVGVDVKEGIDTEVWIADRTGRNARRLTTEPQSLLAWIEWSLDGNKLAYVTEPVRANDRPLDARLIVVDVRSGRRVQIAEGGALGPRWSTDASALFFWKRDGQRWQPNRAASVTERAPLEPAVAMTFSRPGAFSPDALRVAGVEGKDLLVETLATHHRVTIPLPVGLLLETMEWSTDSEWLYLRGTYGGIIRPTMNYAARLADGKVVPLDTSLAVFEPLQPEERVQVTTASWLPHRGHRLLLWAHRRLALDDHVPPRPQPGYVPEDRWLILDADTGATPKVTGLEDLSSAGTLGNPVIRWDSDGSSVLIGNEQYHFNRPR